MERITKDQLRRTFIAYEHTCRKNGLIGEGMELIMQEGSKTYGVAYRLAERGIDRTVEGWSGHRGTMGGSYLGMTTREAYDNLHVRLNVLWDVATIKGWSK